MIRIWREFIERMRESFTMEVVDDVYVSIVWKRPPTFTGQATLEIREAVLEYLEQGQRLFLFDLRKTKGANSWGMGNLYGSVVCIQEAGGGAVLLLRKNKFFEILKLVGADASYRIEFEHKPALERLVGSHYGTA